MKTNKGQSIVGLLIGLIIGAGVLVASLVVLGRIYGSRNSTIKLEHLSVASENIYNDLTQDIHWSKDATIENSNTKLRLIQHDDSQIVYELVDSGGGNRNLVRSGSRLNPADVIVSGFEVYNRSGGCDQCVPLLEISLSLDSKEDPKVQLTKTTTISVRKQGGVLD